MSLDGWSLEFFGSRGGGEDVVVKGKIVKCGGSSSITSSTFLVIVEDVTMFAKTLIACDGAEYRDKLIGVFSHELRTPLNSSMGFL